MASSSDFVAQRVAILHRPQIVDRQFRPTAQSRTKVREPIELPSRRLALTTPDGSEVIPVNGRCASRDGASRPLSVIVLIPGHAMFRRHIR